jgi:hypothetical protein
MMHIMARHAKNTVFWPKIEKNPLRIGAFVITLRPLVRKDKSPKGESPITWQQAR